MRWFTSGVALLALCLIPAVLGWSLLASLLGLAGVGCLILAVCTCAVMAWRDRV
jgi:hypothetical protein